MNKIKLLDAAKMYAYDKLNAYFEHDGYYCATDSRLLVMVPKEQITEEIEITTEGTPNFSFVLNKEKLLDPVKFKLGELVSKLQEVPMIDEYDDCYNCDGDGKVECECCGNLSDCEECDGTGEGRPTGQKEIDYNYHIQIFLSYLNVSIVNRFVTALKDVGYSDDDFITVLCSDTAIPIKMEIDGILIICSVSHYNVVEKEKLIKVL